MTEKIKLTMTVTWEYEPNKEDYDEGMTIEQMAEFEATQPEVPSIIRGEGKYSDVKWEITGKKENVKMTKEELIKELKKENDSRWIGKPDYSCLSCSHSMTTGTQLICVENKIHKEVEDDHLCKEWI